MTYIRVMLDELVSEGFVECYVDEISGHLYYSSRKEPRLPNAYDMFMIDEARASCELDRDGTYAID